MVGYVLQKGVTFDESTDIQGQDRLIQVASPNSTDRFTYYPKVSQGDWSGGERQLFFVDPSRYYSSDGHIDPTKPGALQLAAVAQNITLTGVGNSNSTMCATIGTDSGTYIGISRTSPSNANLMLLSGATASFLSVAGQGANEPTQLMADSGDANFYAGFPGVGIWQLPVSSPGAGSQCVNEAPPALIGARQMGYLNGTIYYVNLNAGVYSIKSFTVPRGAAAGDTAYTVPAAEGRINALGTGAGSIIFVTSSTRFEFSRIWSFDGATPSLIGRVEGMVVDMLTTGGVTYLLCGLTEASFSFSSFNNQYTLYSLTGGSLAVVDDLRLALSDFQAVAAPIQPMEAGIATDGRFLYVAWPESNLVAYDLASQSTTVIDINKAGAPGTASQAHKIGAVATANTGLYEIVYNGTTFVCTWIEGGGSNTRAPTGTLTSSFYDFSTPTTVKIFRAVEVELVNPLPSGSTLTLGFAIDNAAAFTTLTTIAKNSNDLIAYFPTGTKGTRVRLQITLTRGSSVQQSPVVRLISTNARLGRVWKTTVQVPRRLLLHDNSEEARTSQALIGNIQNCYKLTSGYCTLFIPNPSLAAGTEQVNAYIESYTWKSAKPGPVTDSQPGGSFDSGEGLIDLALVEVV